jgi:hypothetical protein
MTSALARADIVTTLVSALQALEDGTCEVSEFQYEKTLRSGLKVALAHAIRLGDDADFATGTALRAFVIDNAEALRDALMTPASSSSVAVASTPTSSLSSASRRAASSSRGDSASGTAAIERLLLFVS